MDPKDSHSLAREQFGREAAKYVTSAIHSSTDDLDFVRNIIHPESNWSVLDIATGTGHLALSLAPYVASVIASDITPEMLEETRKQIQQHGVTNLTTEEIDVHHIPYPDNSFDLVTSRIAPHHFLHIEDAIREMERVCKIGGYIFIEDTVAPDNERAAAYFNEIERLRDPSHIRDLSGREWTTLLSSHRCELVSQTSRSKSWPLRWWTDRMSTSSENIAKILRILDNIYEEYKDIIHIQYRDQLDDEVSPDPRDYWSLHPHNGYFLVKKQ